MSNRERLPFRPVFGVAILVAICGAFASVVSGAEWPLADAVSGFAVTAKSQPVIACSAVDCLVVWQSDEGIVAQRTALDGMPLHGAILRISTSSSVPAGSTSTSYVAWSGSSYVVVWRSAAGVVAARVDDSVEGSRVLVPLSTSNLVTISVSGGAGRTLIAYTVYDYPLQVHWLLLSDDLDVIASGPGIDAYSFETATDYSGDFFLAWYARDLASGKVVVSGQVISPSGTTRTAYGVFTSEYMQGDLSLVHDGRTWVVAQVSQLGDSVRFARVDDSAVEVEWREAVLAPVAAYNAQIALSSNADGRLQLTFTAADRSLITMPVGSDLSTAGNSTLIVSATSGWSVEPRHSIAVFAQSVDLQVVPIGRLPGGAHAIGRTASLQSAPVISQGNQGWLAAWEENRGIGPATASSLDLRIGSIRPDGSRQAGEGIRVAAGTHPVGPALASNGDVHLLVWYEISNTWKVYAQRFATSGAAIDSQPIPLDEATPSPIGYYETGPRAAPAVASDGAGWLVVWEAPDGSGDLRARVFRTDGSPTTTVTIAEGHLDGSLSYGDSMRHHVAPAATFDGTVYWIAWTQLSTFIAPCNVTCPASSEGDIHVSRLTTAGDRLDTVGGIAVAVSTPEQRGGTQFASLRDQRNPSIASNGDGAVVTWTSTAMNAATNLHAAPLTRSGQLRGVSGEDDGRVIAEASNAIATAVRWTGREYEVVWTDRYGNVNEVRRVTVDDRAAILQPDLLLFSYGVNHWRSSEALRPPFAVRGTTAFAAYARLTTEAPDGAVMRAFMREIALPPRRTRRVMH